MNQTLAMTAAFEDFQPRFDDYLATADEYPEEMYFLRYEGPAQLHPLPLDPLDTEDKHQALAQHQLALDECQNYAVSKEVTSTYVFFNVAYYTEWLKDSEREDSIQNRVEWGREQIDRNVTTHYSDYLAWYFVTNAAGLKGILTEPKHVVK